MQSSESPIHNGIQEPFQRHLAVSILNSDNATEIAKVIQCLLESSLGWTKPECFHFEISVGATFGFINQDGRRCMLKVLGPDCVESELQSRIKFQNWIYRNKFPCPSVLVPPTRDNDILFVVEEYLDIGRRANGHEILDRQLMARLLSCLVELGKQYPSQEEIPTNTLLHVPKSPWPKPHNILFDFDATKEGAEWIDEIGQKYGSVLDGIKSDRVIGHLDWGAKHCRIHNKAISAVYDWDSVARIPETRVVGSAAVSFATTWYVECGNRPEISEMITFISEYQDGRALVFSDSELEEIVAAAYYESAYAARCEHAIDHGQKGDKTENREFLKKLTSHDIVGFLRKQMK